MHSTHSDTLSIWSVIVIGIVVWLPKRLEREVRGASKLWVLALMISVSFVTEKVYRGYKHTA